MDQCPACGAPVAPDDDVCRECGARLEGSTESFDVIVEIEEQVYSGSYDSTVVPVLVVRKGVEVGERFYLDRPRLTIGRDPESDIFLNDVTVSRAHAVLYAEGGTARIEDAGSLNGTYVNDVIVNSADLRNGDTVQIGRFQMVFLSGGGA